jgi:hypothetical protein
MKKKKEVKTERKIHKDFTLDEFDVFTMDLQCEGAMHERKAVIEELTKAKVNLQKYSNGVGYESKRVIDGMASGVGLAIQLIQTMPPFEDRCDCESCGA